MGMFDRVWFDCPACGARIEAQSKGGPCSLNDYAAEACPVDVAGDLIGGGEREGYADTVVCEGCSGRFKIIGPRFIDLRLAPLRA